LFDVFASFWFTAIYVLLLVSLIGCLTPRLLDHAKALRAQPVSAPRNLSRLPHHYPGTLDETPGAIVGRVAATLRRWRVSVPDDTVVTVPPTPKMRSTPIAAWCPTMSSTTRCFLGICSPNL
jgi:cytochrome c biogenesis protein ResB